MASPCASFHPGYYSHLGRSPPKEAPYYSWHTEAPYYDGREARDYPEYHAQKLSRPRTAPMYETRRPDPWREFDLHKDRSACREPSSTYAQRSPTFSSRSPSRHSPVGKWRPASTEMIRWPPSNHYSSGAHSSRSPVKAHAQHRSSRDSGSRNSRSSSTIWSYDDYFDDDIWDLQAQCSLLNLSSVGTKRQLQERVGAHERGFDRLPLEPRGHGHSW
ncbi:hypothetical protein AB1Y20_022356 [Prymnesium parvum]|uniref:SAP domain-containing protein n=1 Tax=Prymnesium parvum TaxID=97485 RepID=A0AB34JJ46_PRYPA